MFDEQGLIKDRHYQDLSTGESYILLKSGPVREPESEPSSEPVSQLETESDTVQENECIDCSPLPPNLKESAPAITKEIDS